MLARALPPTLAIARKILTGTITVFVASLVVFWALNVLPQDPAVAALGRDSTPAQRAAFRVLMHLDLPPMERYVHWIFGMIHGDFGTSVINGLPIGGELLQRFAYTGLLALIALVGSVIVALPLAIAVAQRSGGIVDTTVSAAAVGIAGLPEFVVAIVVLFFGAVQLRWFAVSSQGLAQGDWGGVVMPAATLTLIAAAYVFRHARVSVIETMSAPHVRTAILRGFSPRRVLWGHVLPVASVVVVNSVALNAIWLMGGVIVVESVFSYPGLGQLLVQSLIANDYTTVQDVAVVTAALLVAINLLADAVVLMLDPRLRVVQAK